MSDGMVVSLPWSWLAADRDPHLVAGTRCQVIVAQDADEPRGAGEHQPSTDLQLGYVPDNLSELPLLKAVARIILLRSASMPIRW
jgi:hypothetical protein